MGRAPWTAWRHSASSVMLPPSTSTPWRRSSSVLARSSGRSVRPSTTTSAPRRRPPSARWDPMKPVPPVTSSFMRTGAAGSTWPRTARAARRRSARWRARRRRGSPRWPSWRSASGEVSSSDAVRTILSRSVPTMAAVPGLDALGALGDLAQHQHRLAQRGSLFLHPAAVGEDDVGAGHQVDELDVVHRLDQMHPLQIEELAHHHLLDLRVGMHRNARPPDPRTARPASAPPRRWTRAARRNSPAGGW